MPVDIMSSNAQLYENYTTLTVRKIALYDLNKSHPIVGNYAIRQVISSHITSSSKRITSLFSTAADILPLLQYTWLLSVTLRSLLISL